MIRLLLVDDHILMRSGIAAALADQPDLCIVAESETKADALAAFRAFQPDVTIMDLRLPDGTGVEAVEAIRADFPEARILMLSTAEGDQAIHGALAAGALGYLVKTVASEELVRAVRAVARGERYLMEAAAARLEERHTFAELTARELDMVRLIAKGLSNKEIASVLDLSIFTVNNYVHATLRKLQVQDRTQAALVALERGLVET